MGPRREIRTPRRRRGAASGDTHAHTGDEGLLETFGRAPGEPPGRFWARHAAYEGRRADAAEAATHEARKLFAERLSGLETDLTQTIERSDPGGFREAGRGATPRDGARGVMATFGSRRVAAAPRTFDGIAATPVAATGPTANAATFGSRRVAAAPQTFHASRRRRDDDIRGGAADVRSRRQHGPGRAR